MEGLRGQQRTQGMQGMQGMQQKSRPRHAAQSAQTTQRTRRAPYPVSRPGAPYRVVPDVPDVPGDAFDHGDEEQQYPDVGPFGDDIAFAAGDAETEQSGEMRQARKDHHLMLKMLEQQKKMLEQQAACLRRVVSQLSTLETNFDEAPAKLADLVQQYLDRYPEEQFQPANQTIDPMNLQQSR